MAWTAPATVIAGQLMTAAFWNTHVRDNELYIKAIVDPTVLTKTANYTANANEIINCSSAGAFTITLPLASANDNKSIFVKNINTGVITIGRTGADTIDGAASQSLNQYEAMRFVSINSLWWIY